MNMAQRTLKTDFDYQPWDSLDQEIEFLHGHICININGSRRRAFFFLPCFIQERLACQSRYQNNIVSSFIVYTRDFSAFSSTAGREKPSDSITLSGEGRAPAPCARLNRTTASLDALRFEASAHHQAGSCTHFKIITKPLLTNIKARCL
mmetsp:Transcript_18761/g.31979  ORF Transcript_18761/g.31979 Transcript_18761/m.31979 type:complete len:149 (+) Transcript_18761:2671-3117(+)